MNTIPHVFLVSGLPGSGKTYFAKRLAQRLSAIYIGSDQVRRRMFEERSYEKSEKDHVYWQMQFMIREAVTEGHTVVADATFCNPEHREQLNLASLEAGGRPIWIKVGADEEVIKERLTQVREDSEADWEAYLRVKEECVPLQGDYLELDSSNLDVEDMIDRALEYMHQKP